MVLQSRYRGKRDQSAKRERVRPKLVVTLPQAEKRGARPPPGPAAAPLSTASGVATSQASTASSASPALVRNKRVVSAPAKSKRRSSSDHIGRDVPPPERHGGRAARRVSRLGDENVEAALAAFALEGGPGTSASSGATTSASASASKLESKTRIQVKGGFQSQSLDERLNDFPMPTTATPSATGATLSAQEKKENAARMLLLQESSAAHRPSIQDRVRPTDQRRRGSISS